MEGGTNQDKPTPPETQPTPGRAEAEAERRLEPRIYIASLADYNNGRLHGVWVDAWQEPQDIQARINNMLARSKQSHAEEWAIHDFEGFNGLHLGEWENLDHVSKVAKGIRQHGEAYAHWATLVSEDEQLDQFEQRYLGYWPSVTAYAEHLLGELGLDRELDRTVPESLRPYVRLDAEGFGRDLQLGGDISVTEGQDGVYVFTP